MKKLRKKTLYRVIPVLIMVFAASFFIACDAGNDAGQPTGPASEYDPRFPDGAELSLRLSPSVYSLSAVPAPEIKVTATLNAALAAGAPLEGVRIFFSEESGSVAFFPNPSTTDSRGFASSTGTVLPGTLGGSYSVRASTSQADRGPTTRDFATLKVVP